MSLLDNAFEACTLIDKTTQPDGYGGIITVWTEGASFQAAIVLDNSIQARVAAVQGVTDLYTVTTRKAVNLQYHDVFRRESDKKIFRVTSDGDDKKTPASAALNMRQVSCNEYVLASEVVTTNGE